MKPIAKICMITVAIPSPIPWWFQPPGPDLYGGDFSDWWRSRWSSGTECWMLRLRLGCPGWFFFCGFATLQLELWESWEIMGKSIFFRFWVFKNSSTDHVQSLDLGIKFSRCLFHMCNRSERAPVRRIQRIGPGRDQVACSRFFLSESSPTRWCPSSESLSWCK